MNQDTTPLQTRGRLAAALAGSVFHGLGVLLVAALLLIPFVTTDTVSLYAEAVSHGAFFKSSVTDIALHLGLSASMWTLGFILYRLWRVRRASAPRLIKAARGAVFVETLIVIVPFLLLTSGLAQLTMLNVTGVLAHLASYQATRTVWVWQPEADKGRRGVNNAQVNRRAKLAAAAVMAPTAPSGYLVMSNTSDTEFRDLRGTMVGTFLPLTASGSTGKSTAQGLMLLGGSSVATSNNLVFSEAFDSQDFPVRAAKKLTYAYAATEVTVQRNSSTVGTTLVYKQNIVFPWFARIWGSLDSVAGRPGYYITLRRSFSLPAQVKL